MNFVLKPSQWINIGWILFGIIGFPLVIPVIIAIYKILDVYLWEYRFMEDRFIERRGVFVVKHREVYYHRIKSVYMVEPFLMRFVGLSNTYLITSDRYAMNMSLIGLTNGQLFLECLREEMNSSRIRRGVKEIDLFEF